MNFVQTSFLIGTAAVAIPVIVHLLSRFQVRRLELGTMRFLHEVIQDGAQRRRIRRWFLLMTRALLLLLLALLFARPFLSKQTQRDGDRLRIVLIDRSASMGMPGQEGRLLDDAIEAAVNSTTNLGTDAKILWAWFDRHVEPMPDDTVRPVAPRAAVGDTNYIAALRWARDRLDAFPDSAADVVLVTDLQQSGFGAEAVETESLAFPTDVPVRVIDVGRPAANNLAITNAIATSTTVKADQNVQLTVTLFNYGSLPFEEVPATAAAFNGTRTVRLKKSVNVQNGEAEEILFDFGKLPPGTWQVTLAVDVADDLAVDNRRFTAVTVAEPIRIMVLDSGSSGDEAEAKSYFLVAALQQAGHSDEESTTQETSVPPVGRFLAETVYLQDEPLRVLDSKDHPLVVVADAGELSNVVIQQLQNYVAEGGQLLVFPGEAMAKAAAFWQDSGLAPGKLDTPERSGVMPFRIDTVDAHNTMMKPFEDPQHADLSRLAFHKMLPVTAEESTHVLARFDQSRPAVTQHRQGNGSVVWFLSSADGRWSNWTTSPLYLPLVQQMAADLLGLTGEGPVRFRTIGDDDATDSMPLKSEYIPVVANVAAQPSTFDQPGFEKRSDALYIVNGSAKESDPTRSEATAFVKHFGLTAPNENRKVESESVVSEKRNELWPWLAAAVFVLVVAEFGLANRTSA